MIRSIEVYKQVGTTTTIYIKSESNLVVDTIDETNLDTSLNQIVARWNSIAAADEQVKILVHPEQGPVIVTAETTLEDFNA